MFPKKILLVLLSRPSMKKFKPLPLAPIPDQKLIEYATFCFEKPAKFIGSVGDSNPEAITVKWPNKSLPEIAFMGVSNAGKSTLINCLLNTKELAKTSKKPGHTKLLNLFQVAGRFVLVDMPGYGYKSRESWGAMVEKYLKDGMSEKGQLKRVFLLIESKRNFKHYDRMIMELLEKYNVPYQVVITKADKLPPSYWEEAYLSPSTSDLALFLRQRGQSLADPSLLFISPLKARFGISQLRSQILEATDCIPSKLKHLKDQATLSPNDITRAALITPKNERRMNPDFLSKEQKENFD
ncbi:hypothetical protein DSO57_1033185 [Entomophthora muscae]|uniref:Uncharacterized protein n=1 Tax=Entomophthora muscae TaxID=34485 RepID=A0ACC2RET7_9FUNG|nr:hypothetical protein DSO57_1033185 [Entomophthora muscae]